MSDLSTDGAWVSGSFESELSRDQLWALHDGLTELADEESFELEVERLMQLDGLERDEAELVVRARLEADRG